VSVANIGFASGRKPAVALWENHPYHRSQINVSVTCATADGMYNKSE